MSNWAEATGHSSDLAFAISKAEGFGVLGAIPTVAHNPGDLALGDTGRGTLGAEKITIFSDETTGWAALEHQLDLIRDRKSHVYTPSMSIGEMAKHWTSTDPGQWALNVCAALAQRGRKADPSTLLKDVL